MKKLCLLFLIVGLTFTFTSAQQKTVGWSLGYYPTWDHSYSPASIPWEAFTHVANFQVWPNSDGSLGLPDETMSKQLISEGHKRGKKVIFCVGGAGVGDGFKGACSNANRGKFISNIIAYLKKLGYDGIDTDWEENFDDNLFMAWHKDLRDSINKLNPVPSLSIAAEDWYPVTGKIYPYVDMINDMWYGATADKYPGILKTFTDLGAPKSKLGPGFGEDPSSGNLSPQACKDLCNMVINQGYGGIMHWDIVNNGQCAADFAAIAPFVPAQTGIIANSQISNDMPLTFSIKSGRSVKGTQICYSIPSSSAGKAMDIGVYDIKGALVKTLVHGQVNAGIFSVPFTQAAAGTYVIKFAANNTLQTAKAFVTK